MRCRQKIRQAISRMLISLLIQATMPAIVKGQAAQTKAGTLPGISSEWVIDAVLTADGSLLAHVRETAEGLNPEAWRACLAAAQRAETERLIEAFIMRNVSGARVSAIIPHAENSGRLQLEARFSVPHYAQVQAREMVICPTPPGFGEMTSMIAMASRQQVITHNRCLTATAQFRLPSGWSVRKLPETIRFSQPQGSFQAEFELRDDCLVVRHTLQLSAQTALATPDAAARSFTEKIQQAVQTKVAIVRNRS